MTLLTTALATLADAALGASLGAMAFFSFVAAPRAFAVLGSETAGEYVNDVFPRYYAANGTLSALAFVALLAHASGAWPRSVLLAAGCTLVALLCHGFARAWLIPRMEAAGEDAFERYHGWSVGLNGVAMLAVAAALVATHVA